jgi:transcriptional regulator NrdR family protein
LCECIVIESWYRLVLLSVVILKSMVKSLRPPVKTPVSTGASSEVLDENVMGSLRQVARIVACRFAAVKIPTHQRHHDAPNGQ